MDRRTIKKIVVVGGGSAGWLTALYAKRMLPEREVVLVESESIGILGAGEGTTPHVSNLMSFLGISLGDLIDNTECTLKNGIKFVNWNGGGSDDYFYNGFYASGDLSLESCELIYLDSSAPTVYAGSVYREEPFGEADLASRLSELNKLPFIKSIDENKNINYRQVSSYAVHVDASKLADYLKHVATKNRGIRRVEGIVVDFSQDESGDVKSLTLDNGNTISCDFVFDCSGFARIFAKKFDTPWKSHSDTLPSNSALPFFLPISDEEPIPTSGLAVAMSNGWMWNTPLQHRYGCGYVFDSSQISFDEAQKEVEDYLGVDVSPIKEIKFTAGYYTKPWNHNVISVGLASGFIEPLEASSMWVTIVSLRNIFGNVEVLFNKDQRVMDDFNKEFSAMNDAVADFIYFHHMTNRTDTDFWRSFSLDRAPENVKNLMEKFEVRLPSRSDFSGDYWELDTWYRVGLGHKNEVIEKSIKRSNAYNPSIREMLSMYDQYKSVVDQVASTCVDHREFIYDVKSYR